MRASSLKLPTGYYLEKDPDVVILRRLDGSMVGVFSARGVASDTVLRIAEEISHQRLRSQDAPGPEARTQSAHGPAAVRSSLRANFFGRFELLCDGEPVPLGRNGKALTILKYLIANRPVSQDHLMGWLWPESNPRKARWSLNSAVHGLRKLLGDYPPLGSVNCVLLEEGYYRLCPSIQVTTDVEEFEASYREGLRLDREGLPTEAGAHFDRAIGLYRDDYLVEDLYEDWTMVERERLANAYLDMLGRLAVHAMEVGRHHESIRACFRVLEKDRCHEGSHRLLMRCYAHLGLRAKALRQYRLCEKALDQEYGLSPSSETRALYRDVAMGQPVAEL